MFIVVGGRLMSYNQDGDSYSIYVNHDGIPVEIKSRDNIPEIFRERGIIYKDPVICICDEVVINNKRVLLLKTIGHIKI